MEQTKNNSKQTHSTNQNSDSSSSQQQQFSRQPIFYITQNPGQTSQNPQPIPFQLLPLTNPNRLEPGDPLYIPPLDGSDLVLVKMPLAGPENYATWARDFKRALITKDKLGFIEGTVPMPSEPQLQKFWDKANTLVHSWIANCLTSEVAAALLTTENAKELWDFINEMHETLDIAKFFSLHQSLAEIRQGNSSVTSYFSRLSVIWNELDAVEESLQRTPKTLKQYQRIKEQGRVNKFLLGLNEGFFPFVHRFWRLHQLHPFVNFISWLYKMNTKDQPRLMSKA